MEIDPHTIFAACAPEISFIKNTWHIIFLAIWGGVANYIARVKSGKVNSVSIAELFGDLVVSGFVGSIAYFLCREASLSPYLTAATVGMAGHLGSRTVFIAENIILNKYKIKADD